jgi:general secretion pathway protein D
MIAREPMISLFACIRQMRFGVALIAMAFAGMVMVGCVKSEKAYQQSQKPAAQNYDAAYAASEEASRKAPLNAQQKLQLYQARVEAAQFHVREGIKHLEQHENQAAVAEFETAIKIDPSFMLARQELDYARQLVAAENQGPGTAAASAASTRAGSPGERSSSPERANDESNAERLLGSPPSLQPLSRDSLSLQMHEDARVVFRTIGKLAGLNVIFDPEFPENKKVSIDLINVTLQQALRVACVEAKAFWKPITGNIIMILPDNAGKRRQEEEQVLKKIYLQHTQSAQELTELTASVQAMLDLRHVQAVPRDNAILIRDTPDKILLATRLIEDSDRGRAEVVVQISILQVRRDRARSLGIQPGGSTTLSFVPGSPLGPAGSVLLDKLGQISKGDFALTIPSAVASALMSDSATRIIQNPQVRVSDGEAARLRVGDRIPVATGSFQATVGAGVGVNTQFQYIDVGVNIDLLPRVNPDHSVSMKLGVEVSSLNGRVNIGGVEQPVISQRRIDHEIRLQEGEVSVLGGLAERSQSKSVTGWPGLSRLPLLRYLFSGEDVNNSENEVLIVVIPKLVRGREFAHESLQAVSVGTDGDLMLRQQEEVSPPASAGMQPQSTFMEAKGVTLAGDQGLEKDNPPILRLDPAVASLKTGERTMIQVQVENVEDLFSAALMFRYDPALLSVDDVQHGDLLSGGSQEVAIMQRIDKAKGEAGIFTTRQPNTAGVSGKGILLNLVVTRLAEGPATLQLAEVGTRSSRQRALPLKVLKGSVELP